MSLALSTLLFEWRRYMAAVMALALSGLLVLAMTGVFIGIGKGFTAQIERSSADVIITNPTHFAIAGRDRVFKPAEAAIDGDTLRVYNPEIAAPVAVRFGWTDDAEPNLCNGTGLPASPFRTDDWPE